MSETAPPRRSLVAAEFLQPEEDGQVRVLLTCDCGTETDLTIEADGGVPARAKAEAAYTCDGCYTTHWFEIFATGDAP